MKFRFFFYCGRHTTHIIIHTCCHLRNIDNNEVLTVLTKSDHHAGSELHVVLFFYMEAI